MATMTIHASGAARPDEAWDRYLRPARWPDWAPQIRRVQTDAEVIAPGVTGRVVGPAGASIGFVVDEVDPRRRSWAWTVHRWPVTMRLRHGVEAKGAGSRTWVSVEGPLPLVLAYAPIAQLALRKLVAR
jgi:hypothetical protein